MTYAKSALTRLQLRRRDLTSGVANVCNIFMKNLMDVSAGSIVFWLFGFGIMFGLGTGLIGTGGFFFDPTNTTADGRTLTEVAGHSESFSWAFLIFQMVFCATAATIVSGAMAERTRFIAYVLYSILICAFVYPVFGHWA
jgi:ammonium transporter, Amt family